MRDQSLEERGRTLEDQYFRKRDAELLRRAREEAARAERAAGELAQARALAAAYGLEFDSAAPQLQAAVRRLSAAGISEDSAPALELLPALDVAWQGGVDVAERDRLLAAAGLGAASPRTMDLIAGWCVTRPEPEVFEAALVVLRHRLQALAQDERPLLAARVTGACETVAKAAGGWTGFRRVSAAEQRVLDAARAALAGYARD